MQISIILNTVYDIPLHMLKYENFPSLNETEKAKTNNFLLVQVSLHGNLSITIRRLSGAS